MNLRAPIDLAMQYHSYGWRKLVWRVHVWWWMRYAVTIGLLLENPRMWWRIVLVQGYGR